ncbi:Endonuclease-reverse transcriptase [Operophtera brumata]|uniref:Endonuclease-reverse transcriptase n=1 Tax=Operophtera brumata TaxID=104452 RepID=A0A0L7LHJ7_OPEBR|nr:Endonuclease-reverse transcriptase [Operophtera brumata]
MSTLDRNHVITVRVTPPVVTPRRSDDPYSVQLNGGTHTAVSQSYNGNMFPTPVLRAGNQIIIKGQMTADKRLQIGIETSSATVCQINVVNRPNENEDYLTISVPGEQQPQHESSATDWLNDTQYIFRFEMNGTDMMDIFVGIEEDGSDQYLHSVPIDVKSLKNITVNGEVEKLTYNEVEYLKRVKKNNNIIIFGVKEEEKSISDLIEKLKKNFQDDLSISIQDYEVNKIYRIGNTIKGDKPRPVLLSFVNGWKKSEVMKNKSYLKDLYVTEDYSKEVLEKRKALVPKLTEEINKGNIAYLKYDKLIVKEKKNNNNKVKRKREASTSPQTDFQPRKQHTLTTTSYLKCKITTNARQTYRTRNGYQLNKIKWDIIGNSEMRRFGEGIEDYGRYIISIQR